MKTIKTARKRSVPRSAGAVTAAAPKPSVIVDLHPAIVEVRFNGEAGPTQRIPNGAQGSAAAERAERLIADLRKTHSVTVRNFDTQGREVVAS